MISLLANRWIKATKGKLEYEPHSVPYQWVSDVGHIANVLAHPGPSKHQVKMETFQDIANLSSKDMICESTQAINRRNCPSRRATLFPFKTGYTSRAKFIHTKLFTRSGLIRSVGCQSPSDWQEIARPDFPLGDSHRGNKK